MHKKLKDKRIVRMTPKTSCSALTLPIVLLAAVLGFAGVAAPALAQGADTQVLLDRLDRLERDIRTLNQQIARMPEAGEAVAPVPQEGRSAAAPQPAPAPQIEYLENEGAMSRVLARLDALEREVRVTTGTTESLSYRIDQLGVRLDKLLVDLDFRLARLEGGSPGSFSDEARGLTEPQVTAVPSPPSVAKAGAMPPVGTPGDQGSVAKDGTYVPGADEGVGTLGTVSKSKIDQIVGEPTDAAGEEAQASVQPAEDVPAPAQSAPAPAAQPQAMASVLPEGTTEERYRFAFDLTRQARFEEAEVAFKAFLEAHPDAALADNARYWLAETYYVRKHYMEAAQAFFESYKQAPEGAKAPDSLLKLGMSMAGLDKTQEACATFGKLRKEFSPLKANIEQALNREVKRLECK